MKNTYKKIKAHISPRQAAEHYGITVNRQGMACCPFHKDQKPSIKFGNGFYCFGCGAKGDVITFTSMLWGISPHEAAQKLADDFSIPIEEIPRSPPVKPRTEQELWIIHTKKSLHDYYERLVLWKHMLHPESPGSPWHPLFVEALQNQANIRELIHILEFGSKQEQEKIYSHYKEKVITIDEKLRTYEYI